MIITGKMSFIITLIFVQKSRTISALLWTWSKKEVMSWLCHFFCITTGCGRNS